MSPDRLVPEPVLLATLKYHLSETVTIELRNPSLAVCKVTKILFNCVYIYRIGHGGKLPLLIFYFHTKRSRIGFREPWTLWHDTQNFLCTHMHFFWKESTTFLWTPKGIGNGSEALGVASFLNSISLSRWFEINIYDYY